LPANVAARAANAIAMVVSRQTANDALFSVAYNPHWSIRPLKTPKDLRLSRDFHATVL
jgi:hypothetical protein